MQDIKRLEIIKKSFDSLIKTINIKDIIVVDDGSELNEHINYIEGLGIKVIKREINGGCATGNLVKEFVMRGYNNILGSDISPWAIDYGITNGLGEHLKHFDLNLLEQNNKYIIINDVLEHINEEDIVNILEKSKGNIILRVTVCAKVGEDYVLECSRVDRTHIIR